MQETTFISTLATLSFTSPILVALVQLLKSQGVSSRWLPLIGTVLGVCIALVVSGFTVIVGLAGLVIGLSVSGLYELGKTTIAGQ